MRTWVALIAFSVVAGAAGRAAATVGACAGLSDGTPCTDTCIASGHCGGGVCISDQVAPDGTPCSSGDQCSLADSCQAGVCVPGNMKRVCPPAPDSCHVSACSPTLGCTMTLTCVPDMTPPPPPPPPPADMATPPPGDMALPPSADMAAPPAPDMTAPPVVGDMAMDTPDLMGELPNPQRDGGVETVPVGAVPGADMAMTPGAPRTLHVHGSSVGGCAVGGGPGDLTLAALLLVVPFVLRRRRA